MDSSGCYDGYALVADFYDHVTPYRNRQDVAFFVEMARQCGSPVLEVGCGTGRVLIPTARAGVEIVGLDLSPVMLSMCRAALAREPAEVQGRTQLIEADMRRFDLGRTFRLATLPFRPFQHLLTVEDQLSCLASIHRHLVDGGKVVLDVFNPSILHLSAPEYPTEWVDESGFTMPDGRQVIRRHRVLARDLCQQIQEVELLYCVTHPDGREELLSHRFPMRHLFRFEAEHLLARAGFQVEAVYADYDKSPYGLKYPGELIMVACKGL